MTWYCANNPVNLGNGNFSFHITSLPGALSTCNGNPWLLSDLPMTDVPVIQNQISAGNTQNQVLQGQVDVLKEQNSPFNLSLDDAQAIAVPILLVWAIAFVFRIIRKTLETTDSISD